MLEPNQHHFKTPKKAMPTDETLQSTNTDDVLSTQNSKALQTNANIDQVLRNAKARARALLLTMTGRAFTVIHLFHGKNLLRSEDS